jgi:acyl-homoserine-lactone acylase
MQHFKAMYLLEESQYPEIADAIRKLKRWNLKGEVHNEDAALAMIVHDFLRIKFDCPFALLMIREAAISEADAVWAIKKAKKYLLRHHGTLDVPLGTVQRLIRGEHSYPVDGLREVLRAADSKQAKHHKGQFAVSGGDCFIQITEFGPNGPEIKTINAFGASSYPESVHYSDQMELFAQHGWKKMSFDKAMILQNAERVYHPAPNLAKDSR